MAKTFRQKREDEIRRISSKRFKDFIIEEQYRIGVNRSWICRDPKSWDCSFTITTIPYHLIVTGDLGDLIVSRSYDMLPWCRGSAHSTEYFAEKVPHGYQTHEFCHEVLREWICDKISEYQDCIKEDPSCARDYRDRLTILHDTLSDGVENDYEGYFIRHLEDIWIDEIPNWHAPTERFLWLRDAVAWFCSNHDEEVVLEPK